jgi:tRNA (Thr-GGU) A37 N-methylase
MTEIPVEASPRRPRRAVGLFAKRATSRGTRRVHQVGHARARQTRREGPIGLHRVKIRSIAGGRAQVRNLEAVDGTPIVDVKPTLSSDITER